VLYVAENRSDNVSLQILFLPIWRLSYDVALRINRIDNLFVATTRSVITVYSARDRQCIFVMYVGGIGKRHIVQYHRLETLHPVTQTGGLAAASLDAP